MSNNWGLYLIIFAVLYFMFTALVVGHGIHFTNSIISVGMVIAGIILYNKSY